MAQSAEEIFLEALDIPPGEREAFILKVCGGSPDLIHAVRAYLADSQAADAIFSARASVGFSSAGSLFLDQPGDQIGPYTLLELIGEGGFGVVWLAEQKQPLMRKVALKIVKAGMDTAEVLARFEAERQALARMEHPHIARVLDAGATPRGRPYFVMEWVRGIPITKFCDENQLGMRQRLSLFLDVCAAVGHAHQKGIIHRDIKPSNILVAVEDGKPTAKVIDFGIAKAVEGRLTDFTLLTRHEQVLGTPAYMSPEQAGLENRDIDTRSDIYSLGVLLYELIAGVPPFDSKTLLQAGYEEMRRVIREVEPLRPSSRITTIAPGDATQIAVSRNATPNELRKLIAPELDWIVMKAIEKMPARRYDSAGGFSLDIERFLQDEPVLARPPSRRYLLGKFVRRHKGVLLMAAGIGGILVGAAIFSTMQAVRAREAENVAEERLLEATTARDRETQARDDAEAVAEFFRGIFAMPNPETNGRDIKIADALDASAIKLEGQFATQPRRRGLFQETLAGTYANLGQYAQSLEFYRKALASYNEAGEEAGKEYLRSLNELINLLTLLGHYREAADEGTQYIVLLEKQEGIPPEILGGATTVRNENWFSSGRREEALTSQEELVKRLEESLGSEQKQTRAAIGALNSFRYRMGVETRLAPKSATAPAKQSFLPPDWLNNENKVRIDQIRRELENARTQDDVGSTRILETQSELAWELGRAGRVEEATPLMRDALEKITQKYGDSHAKTLEAESDRAFFLWRTQQFKESHEAWRSLLTKKRAIFGPDHLQTLMDQIHLADQLVHAGQLEEADRLASQAVDSLRRVAGKTSALHHAMGVLSRCKVSLGKWREALNILEECAPNMSGDTYVNVSLARLAVWFQRMDLYEETRNRMLVSTPASWGRSTNRPDVYERAVVLASLAPYKNDQQAKQVQNLLSRAQELRSTPGAIFTRNNPGEAAFARCLAAFRLGDDEEVQRAYEECIKLSRPDKSPGENPLDADFVQAMSLSRRGQKAEARRLFDEIISALPPLPPDQDEVALVPHWTNFSIRQGILQREAVNYFSNLTNATR